MTLGTGARMQKGAEKYRAMMATRRTVRQFSTDPVPASVIETCIRAAASGPSGANKQPWSFVAISDPDTKRRIRERAEAAERAFYASLAPNQWLDDLKPLGTVWRKSFLEDAPWLIAVFAQLYGIAPDGSRVRHYYVRESVGIAVGFLISALHHAGLDTLTYTPTKTAFLSEVLNRPENERPYMIVVAGRRAADAVIPDIERKPFGEVATFI